MTVRERWFSAVRREEIDRLLFWPKLDMAYTYRYGEQYGFKTPIEFHRFLGSEMLHGVPSCVEQKHAKCAIITAREGDERRTVIETPLGDIRYVYRFDKGSQAWHPTEFAIKSARDLERMIAYLEDIELSVSDDNISAGLEEKKRWGDWFFSWEPVGESPLMHYVEHLAGVETAHYLLADNQTLVEEFFDAWHEVLKRTTELKAEHSVADMLAFIENTSTTLISPTQYRTYCAKHIGEYSQICREHDRILALHMCGHLRDILPDLATVGANVFEAFTSPTVGNTPLAMGRKACPEVCLIGGTNAALWTRPAKEIIARIEQDLADLPHHRGVVLSSAGVMPPLASPGTIREVCDWVHRFPAVN
jgi:hypothetical protein